MLFTNPFIRRLKLLKERSDFMKLIKKLTALSLSLAIIGTGFAVSKTIVPSTDNTLTAKAHYVDPYTCCHVTGTKATSWTTYYVDSTGYKYQYRDVTIKCNICGQGFSSFREYRKV